MFYPSNVDDPSILKERSRRRGKGTGPVLLECYLSTVWENTERSPPYADML